MTSGKNPWSEYNFDNQRQAQEPSDEIQLSAGNQAVLRYRLVHPNRNHLNIPAAHYLLNCYLSYPKEV